MAIHLILHNVDGLVHNKYLIVGKMMAMTIVKVDSHLFTLQMLLQTILFMTL